MPDLGFLQRVYRMSALLGALGTLAWSGTAQWRLPMGWIAGVTLGLLVLRSKELLCRTLVAASPERRATRFVPGILASYLFIGLILWLVVHYDLGNLLTLMLGLTMVLGVIVLKALGWQQAQAQKATPRALSTMDGAR